MQRLSFVRLFFHQPKFAGELFQHDIDIGHIYRHLLLVIVLFAITKMDVHAHFVMVRTVS